MLLNHSFLLLLLLSFLLPKEIVLSRNSDRPLSLPKLPFSGRLQANPHPQVVYSVLPQHQLLQAAYLEFLRKLRRAVRPPVYLAPCLLGSASLLQDQLTCLGQEELVCSEPWPLGKASFHQLILSLRDMAISILIKLILLGYY